MFKTAKPFKRSCPMVDLKYFFRRLNEEKFLSALAVVTGMVANKCNNIFMIGKNLSQCFNVPITVSDFIV